MRILGFLGMTACLFVAAGCSNSTTPAPRVPTTQAWLLTAGGSAQNEALQGLEFYPNAITIDAGDSVTWNFPSGEPHTVAFLPAGKTLPSPADPGNAVPAGGTTWDGSTYTSSGFVLLGKSYMLTFPQPGTWTFYCLIHPGMMGTITVNKPGTPYPQTQAQLDAAGASAQGADLQAALGSAGSFPYASGGSHLSAGIAAGGPTGPPANGTVLRFLDTTQVTDTTTVTIPVNSSLTWTNLSNNEPHTVTLGVAGQPFPVLPPFSPPSGGSTYDGTQVTNSGVLLPGQSYTLTFTKSGTYAFNCLFHDDTEHMIGTVVVQ